MTTDSTENEKEPKNISMDSKNDIIKIIRAVSDYLDGKIIDQDYYHYITNVNGGMYELCRHICRNFTSEEFFNVLSIMDHHKVQMWTDVLKKYEKEYSDKFLEK